MMRSGTSPSRAAAALPWVCARRHPASCTSWGPAPGNRGRWGRRGRRGPGKAAPPADTPAATLRSPGPGRGRRGRAVPHPPPPPAPSPPPPLSPPSSCRRCCRCCRSCGRSAPAHPGPARPDIPPHARRVSRVPPELSPAASPGWLESLCAGSHPSHG